MTGSELDTARLGVVIPTLDEEASLPLLLADLAALPIPVDVVVVDGGSRDRTIEVAGTAGARTVVSGTGRALQMNAGARALQTPWILFLHADSRLPPETGESLVDWIEAPSPAEAAHFTFRLDRKGLWWTLIERGQWVRERLTGLTYGDQGLLLSRRRYDELDGIPEVPLMEDVETVRRLRRSGGLDRIDAPLVTSSRRYVEEGPFVAWLRNAILIALYASGVPPEALTRWHRPRRTARGAPVSAGPAG